MFNHDYIVLVYVNSHKSLAKILKFSDFCKYYIIFFVLTDNFLQNIAFSAQNGRNLSVFFSVYNRSFRNLSPAQAIVPRVYAALLHPYGAVASCAPSTTETMQSTGLSKSTM